MRVVAALLVAGATAWSFAHARHLGVPRRARRSGSLAVRGGGVPRVPSDGVALVKAFAVLGGFDKVVQSLAAREVLSRPAARKLMHMGAGPLYLLCWPLFGAHPSARFWAAVGPLCLTLKAVAAGSGLVDDPKTVASMSRSGDRRELLRGPTLYGATFVGATVLAWRKLPGVLALVALCAGDGAAEVIGGTPWSRRHSPRIPWCRRKSLAGTAAFFAATLTAGTAFAIGFRRLDWWAVPTPALVRGCATVAGVTALAESFDTGAWDNPLIFAVAILSARRAFPA